MSYKDGKKEGTIEMVCDHKGCTKRIVAANKSLANVKARTEGWKGFSAKEHYCADHKVEHGARAAKAKADGKGAKKAGTKKAATATKKGKGTGKLAKSGRVWEYVPPEG